jgi:hypothetical protein
MPLEIIFGVNACLQWRKFITANQRSQWRDHRPHPRIQESFSSPRTYIEGERNWSVLYVQYNDRGYRQVNKKDPRNWRLKNILAYQSVDKSPNSPRTCYIEGDGLRGKLACIRVVMIDLMINNTTFIFVILIYLQATHTDRLWIYNTIGYRQVNKK